MSKGRQHDIKIRMNDNERELLREKMEQAGNKSLQSYGLDALLRTQITPKEEIDVLIEINQRMSELARIERGVGVNVNQIARYVNQVAEADSETIEKVKNMIASNKEEREKVWLSIRLLLMHLRHMEH